MPVITVNIEANLFWRVAKDRKAGFWVGECPPLKLAAQGKTFAELLESIDDGLQLFFRDVLQAGELKAFLREHGWKILTPLPTTKSRVRFDVPYEIRQRTAHDLQTALN